MAERIRRHRAARGSRWETFEVPVDVPESIQRLASSHPVLLVDCLTLWLSNLVSLGQSDRRVGERFDRLIDSLKGVRGKLVLVSNEVGLGVVPSHSSGRRFRDLSGVMHQKVAAEADEVYWVMAGLPLRLK